MSVFLLSAAGFTVMTTEFMIIGMLPVVAVDLGCSVTQAGYLVTLFAAVVALLGPPLTAWGAAFERRRMFVCLLLLTGFANLMGALAGTFLVMAVSRVLAALALPVFWSLASEAVSRSAPEGQAGRAMARFGIGMICATVFGIPGAALISDALGWRMAFALLGGLALTKAWLLALCLPVDGPMPCRRVQRLLCHLRSASVLRHFLLTILTFAGIFSAYTYLADMLVQLAGLDQAWVGGCLMLFGVVGLAGNHLGGRLVDGDPLLASAGCSALLIFALLCVVPVMGSPFWLVVFLGIWGGAQSALFLICHVRMMGAVVDAPALGAAINVCACNIGISLGAFTGGQIIDSLGLSSIGAVAACIMAMALMLALAMLWAVSRHQQT